MTEICVFSSSKKWVKIADTTENTTTLSNSIATKTLIQTNKYICGYINKNDISDDDIQSNTTIICDDLECTILSAKAKYRHGTCYYVAQRNTTTNICRILTYATNRIHHTRQGTDPITMLGRPQVENLILGEDEISNVIQKYIKEIKKKYFLTKVMLHID